MLHTIHITQARCHQPAKDHLDGKRAEHKTAPEKPAAPTNGCWPKVVIRRMWADPNGEYPAP